MVNQRPEWGEFRLKTISSAVLLCCLSFAAAQAQSAPTTSLTDNPVYAKDCAKCHGKTAEGRHFGGPSLVSEKVAATSADDLKNIISNGKGHMPKFAEKLKPEEIDALVQQIQAGGKK